MDEKKTDFERVVEAIKAGKTRREAMEDGSIKGLQLFKMYDEVRACLLDEDKEIPKPELIICIGGSGSGKTTWAREELGEFEDVSVIRGRFFGERELQSDNLLFDNLRILSTSLYWTFKQMFNDRPNVRIPVRGKGYVQWEAKRVIITCLTMEKLIPRGEIGYQLAWRADKIYKFTKEDWKVPKDVTEAIRLYYRNKQD